MDQDALAWTDARDVFKRVTRRQKCHRDGDRCLKAEMRRLAPHQPFFGCDKAREAATGQGDYLVAGLQPGDAGPYLYNDTRALATKRAGFSLVDSECAEHITEIETRSPHLDLHFAFARLSAQDWKKL